MVEIDIAPGETERIVGRDQANRNYTLEVVSGPVRLHHQQRYASEGTKYATGDRGELQRLDGKPLFAHNPGDDDATIEISQANFLFSLFTQSPDQVINVQNEVDRVVQRSDYWYEWNTTTVTAGTSENLTFNISSNDDPVAIEAAHPSFNDYVEQAQYVVKIDDSDGNKINSTYSNPVDAQIKFEPPVRVPPGGTITCQARNNGGSDEDFYVSLSGHYVRD